MKARLIFAARKTETDVFKNTASGQAFTFTKLEMGRAVPSADARHSII
jgi:hypothetical protein